MTPALVARVKTWMPDWPGRLCRVVRGIAVAIFSLLLWMGLQGRVIATDKCNEVARYTRGKRYRDMRVRGLKENEESVEVDGGEEKVQQVIKGASA